MALHGKAYVNDHDIIAYSIVRQYPPFAVAETVCHYKWDVQYRDLKGNIHQYHGELNHCYGEGAVALLAKVFTEAAPLVAATIQRLRDEEPGRKKPKPTSS